MLLDVEGHRGACDRRARDEGSAGVCGVWDGETRTLTWTAPAGEGRTMTAQSRFVGDDAAEWSVVTKDDAGKVYFRMEGKSTRVKEAKE